MNISNLLDRLEGVRKVGDGRWIARCPSHQDKRASLGVTERDGRLLIHCFAGCETRWVLGGIGMTLSDLFEKQPDNTIKPIKRKWSAHQILMGLGESMSLVAFYLQRLKTQTLTIEEEQHFQKHISHVILLCHEGCKE